MEDTASGGVAEPVVDRRFPQAGYVEQTTYRDTISESGWYTIASQAPLGNGPDTSLNLANGLFTVRDTQAGRYSSTTFWASYQNGSDPTITVLQSSAGNDARAIQGARLVAGGDNDGAEVQINVQLNTNSQVSIVEYTLQNNYHYGGWYPEDWITGTEPQGYDSTDVYWRGSGYVMATAADGTNRAQFGVTRDGTVAARDVDRDTVGMRATMTSDQLPGHGSVVDVTFDRTDYDDYDAYDTGTFNFTVPEDGTYLLEASLLWTQLSDNQTLDIGIYANGTEKVGMRRHVLVDYPVISANGTRRLSAGDTVDVRAYHNGTATDNARIIPNDEKTWFTVSRLG